MDESSTSEFYIDIVENKKTTLITGVHSCIEALEQGKSLDKILVKKGGSGDNLKKVMTLAKDHGVPVQQVPVEKLNRMTELNHQGVVGMMSLIDYHDLDEIVSGLIERGEKPFGLILDGVTDVRNFGAICRTASCFGVHFIVIPAQGSAQINSEAIRTSSGALHTIPICKVNHLLDAVHLLHANEVRVIAATEKSEVSIGEGTFEEGLCIVMGSEERGVSTSLLKNADAKFRIPMTGNISSLNVSVAAGIVLFKVAEQRLHRT